MSHHNEMTWSTLIEDVLSYCERNDEETRNQIPRLIALAENRLASEVRGLGFLRVLRGQMEAGNPVIEKPETWRETASFRVFSTTRSQNIYKRQYEFCRAYSNDTGVKRTPKYYADYDFNKFFVVPSPDRPYDFELVFYERPVPLSEQNETNWTTVNAPQLLLYATLLEAQVFLKKDDRINTFKDLYLQAAQAILGEAQRRELDRSSGQPA